MKKRFWFYLILAVLVFVAIIVFSSCFVTVPTGHTGVVVTFGSVEDYVLSDGVHFKLPWQTVVKMDNRTQIEKLNLQAFSSDIQQVDVICAVNFSINRETSQNLYRNVGAHYYQTVMEPRILENIKSVFAKYSAENLVESRQVLSTQIEDLLKPEMQEYGIKILSVSVEDIDFTDVFTDAVEAKQVAEQSKLQAAIEQQQKTMEQEELAKRQVIEANANAEVEKINADAAAYSQRVKAEAEADANKQISASLTDLLVRYTELMQWDGELPQFVADGSTLPILDTREN